MAKQIQLTAQKRSGVGRSANRKIRRLDQVPAVLYGAHCEPENLQLEKKPLATVLSHATNEHMIVELAITTDGKQEKRPALIQAVQHHPISTEILHVDLLAVSMNETITSEVPLEPMGESVGVKTRGGILEILTRSLEIECLPKDLPDLISFDISPLGLGDALHVRDLKLPPGVTALSDAEQTVAMVAEPTVAVAAEETPAAAPEVIKEKKSETDD